MQTHKIAIDVDEDLFRFHQSLLPWGERCLLYIKILNDIKTIHEADPKVIRDYVDGKINLLEIKDRIERKKK